MTSMEALKELKDMTKDNKNPRVDLLLDLIHHELTGERDYQPHAHPADMDVEPVRRLSEDLKGVPIVITGQVRFFDGSPTRQQWAMIILDKEVVDYTSDKSLRDVGDKALKEYGALQN